MHEKVKPLKDIRYYECLGVPGPGLSMPSSGTELVGVPRAAHQIGQRIACLLHAEGFSVGSYDHVYVAFTPALPEGKVIPTDFGLEWWQRYVAYGVSPDFKLLPESEKLQRIQSATFDVLHALNPAESPLIKSVCERLATHGDRIRILRAAKETKKYRFEVFFDIPPWRESTFLYVTAQCTSSGEILEAAPYPLRDYEDAFALVATLTFSGDILTLNPRKSFRAGLSTKEYQTPLQFPLSKFVAQQGAQGSTSPPSTGPRR